MALPSFSEEYRTRDKSEWGIGPWNDEPDKAVWVDETTGLDCMVVRSGGGALCGYVGVTKGHRAFGVDYGDVEPCPSVHGGLTYSDRCQESAEPEHGICHVPAPGRPDHVWWLGFDCAHAFDLSPGSVADDRRRADEALASGDAEAARVWGHVDLDETYRDLAYVVREVESLAAQLAP